MKISAKIILGFSILTLAVLINVVLTIITLNINKHINQKISETINPSVNQLEQLTSLITNSKMLIKNWVFIERQSDTPDKQKLKDLHTNKYFSVKEKLSVYVKNWNEEDKKYFDTLCIMIEDTLFPKHQYIMNQLSSFESYDDAMIVFELTPMVEEGGEVIIYTDKILTNLSFLLNNFNTKAEQGRNEMEAAMSRFARNIILLGIALVIIVVITALSFIRMLVKPVNYVKNILLDLSKGMFPEVMKMNRKDEIGEMTRAMNLMLDNLRKTANFSFEIGKGNYNTEFKSLSEQDVLGNSLLNMREALVVEFLSLTMIIKMINSLK
ncbi:MAG: HAMP domain-containing protein [Bacteroidia bacterium]|nr:HAMP domain-containing protein [Bacteroidia bacterium]